ncbi:MAG TPA: hypothetical protein VFI96_08580, partial [Longimicrobiaceae bacterium]|nr:hypothetical protein [Longimicrobiaceae bacterium]
MTTPLKTRLISGVGGGLLTSLMATTRFRATDEENYLNRPGGRTAIYLLWHGRLLPCSWRHRH